MMYLQKLVAAVKVNGKVLRENDGTIYVPFNSEYSITIKNLESVKAVVSISIDGTNVTDNREIIVMPNSSVELEGFIKNKKVANKFKFIERTSAISNYRGNKLEDGLIRISFKFEKKQPNVPIYYINSWHTSPWNYRETGVAPMDLCGASTCCSTSKAKAKAFNNDVGITTKGSESEQSFILGSVKELESEEHVMVLALKGERKDKKLSKPIETTSKIVCDCCGKKNKSSNKFCGRCGTALF